MPNLAKVHQDSNPLDHKFIKVKPIKLKEDSSPRRQERIEDVLNSILEGQKKTNEELAQISWIANSALQVNLANQAMLSTLCMDDSPKPKQIPHFQFLKKRARDFNEVSFQLSSPIKKNMSMDSYPKEVVPWLINNGAIKSLTNNFRHWRNFSNLHKTLSEALEKLQAKGLLKSLDPKPIPHPMHRSYNPHAHCKYHQGGGHTTDKCYNLRHAIQNLIDEQVITPSSLATHPNFSWFSFYKFLDWLFGFIVYLGFVF